MSDALSPVFPASADVIDNELTIAGVRASELAERWSTPLIVYDEAHIVDAAKRWRSAFDRYEPGALVAYASKAFANIDVVRVLSDLGLGVDVSSIGEFAVAQAAGVATDRIVVHGNNKSHDELDQAISHQAGLIVVDADDELDLVQQIAQRHQRVQSILVRLNPDIHVETHRYIRTAHAGSKFGVDAQQARDILQRAVRCSNIRVRGVHVHLGSQLLHLDPWREVLDWLGAWVAQLHHATGISLDTIDLGGGLGIAYLESDDPPSIESVAATIIERVTSAWQRASLPLPRLIVEPGRSIVGQAGVTLYRVGVVKESGGHRYVNVDGGFSDNPRPMLYQAEYSARLATRMHEPSDGTWWIAGHHCESGDVLVEDAPLPRPRRGDILAIAATGAYSLSMASNYNMTARPAAVMIASTGEQRIIQRRETLDDVLATQREPARPSDVVTIEDAVQIATDRVVRDRPDLARSVVLAAAGAAALGVGAGERISAEAVVQRTLTLLETR